MTILAAIPIDWGKYDNNELKRLAEFILVKSGYNLIDIDLSDNLKDAAIIAEKDERIILLVEKQPSSETPRLVNELMAIEGQRYLYLSPPESQDELHERIEESLGGKGEILGQLAITRLFLNHFPPIVGFLYLMQHEIQSAVFEAVELVLGAYPNNGGTGFSPNTEERIGLQTSLWELKDLSSAWYMSFYHLSFLAGDARDSLDEEASIRFLSKMNSTLDEIKRKTIDRFLWRFTRLISSNIAILQTTLSEKATRSPIYNLIRIPAELKKYLPGSGMEVISEETEGELLMLRMLKEIGETYDDSSHIPVLDGVVQLMGYYASVGKGLDYLIDSLYEKLNSVVVRETEEFTAIDSGELKVLLEVVMTAKTNDEKGSSLEALAEYIFNSVDGFKVLPSTRTWTGELDRRVRNSRVNDPFFVWVGTHFIIEAKNWAKPVSADAVSALVNKVRKHKCRFGVLITKNGVTGKDMKNAEGIIYDAFKEEITIVVLEQSDLESLIQGTDLVAILKEKSEEVKFR